MTHRIGGLTTIAPISAVGPVHPQALSKSVDATLSHGALVVPGCVAGSSVVRVCDDPTSAGNATVGASPHAFGRGEAGSAGAAQRLDAVMATGPGVPRRRSIEAILQDALAPSTAVHEGPFEAHAGAAGTRYACDAACPGSDCCIEVRRTPGPACDSNPIGR